ERNQKNGRLSFTTELPDAIAASEIVIVAVGPPPGENGSADLQHVLDVAAVIGRHMARETVVAVKSTVPVGSSAGIARAIAAEAKFPFHICSNPEFLKEGAAVEDFMPPDRVVVLVSRTWLRWVVLPERRQSAGEDGRGELGRARRSGGGPIG